MLSRRDDSFVSFPVISVEHGVLAMEHREFPPDLLRTVPGAIIAVKSDDLPDRSIESRPNPLLVCVAPDEAPYLISFGGQAQEFAAALEVAGHLKGEIIRQRLISQGHEGELPRQADIHDAADARQ